MNVYIIICSKLISKWILLFLCQLICVKILVCKYFCKITRYFSKFYYLLRDEMNYKNKKILSKLRTFFCEKNGHY